MLNISNELKTKLIEAKSAEEVAEVLQAAGQVATAEEAAHLWERIKRDRELSSKELSPDELAAFSAGEDRDWLRDGCAATVEGGSDCWGTDKCGLLPVTYKHAPTRHKCSVCGGILYSNGATGGGSLRSWYITISVRHAALSLRVMAENSSSIPNEQR